MGNVVCSSLETPLSSSTVPTNYNVPYDRTECSENSQETVCNPTLLLIQCKL